MYIKIKIKGERMKILLMKILFVIIVIISIIFTVLTIIVIIAAVLEIDQVGLKNIFERIWNGK